MRQRGFTLLELVVATAIVVVIGVAAAASFNALVTNRERVGLRADELAAAQRTFLFLQRDIEQAVPRPARDELGDEEDFLRGNLDGSLELTRLGWFNPLESRQRSTLQRVRWRLDGDLLVREYWEHPDRQVGAQPVRSELLAGVTAFRVQYLDKDSTGAWQWADAWPPAAVQDREPLFRPAPYAVSVELVLPTLGTVKRFFRVVANPHARET